MPRILAALCLALLLLPSAFAADRPNVVLIISDDQAWNDYGFMGHPHIRTPNLDRLAVESLTFTRGYVPSSLCRPSLATIISGLYPHQHRIVGNDPAGGAPGTKAADRTGSEYAALRQRMIDHLDQVPTLPRLLSTVGYRSHQSGKWWEGSYQRGGFTEGMTRGFPEPGGRHGDDGLAIGRQGLQPIFDFIERSQASGEPFFVWYAPFLPHTPHNPPERLLDHYRSLAPTEPIAKYWAMCEWFDETCGSLLGYLDEHGLQDNTLVVYVTDNGWLNLAHRSAYAPRSKRSPNEAGIRTPIMLRWPHQIAPRMDDQNVVSSIDLAPTILAACGVQPTDAMHGIDLRDDSSVRERAVVCGEIFDHDVVDVDHPQASLQYRWIIRMPWKLIVPDRDRKPNARPELYQLVEDPHERENVAAAHPERVLDLASQLELTLPVSGAR